MRVGCNLKGNVTWKGMWVAIVWEIWHHRNKVVFKNGIVDSEEIFYLAQIKGWSWAKFRNSGVIFSMSDWFLNLKSCIKSLV